MVLKIYLQILVFYSYKTHKYLPVANVANVANVQICLIPTLNQ